MSSLASVERGGRDTEKAPAVELPEDILIEILLRLPVKSLLKFKTVCKSWCSVINSPRFIKQHLNHAHATHYNQDKNFLGFVTPWEASNPCVVYKEQTDGTIHAKKFDIPYQLPNGVCNYSNGFDFFPYQLPNGVCNYCDGLICLEIFGFGILLLNPSLPTEYKMIEHSDLNYGFTLMAYDSTTDDYKIVSIPSSTTDEMCCDKYVFVEVYSLKRKSWRKKTISNFFAYIMCQMRGIYTRNLLHWIGTRVDKDNEMDLIIYFDLAEERLDYVNLPTRGHNDWIMLIYKECFGIMGRNSEGQEELWVLQEYRGMRSSWNKIFKITSKYVRFDFYGCFTKKGDILTYKEANGLIIYDIKDGTFKDAQIEGDDIIINKDDSFYASPYIESLVSPKWL